MVREIRSRGITLLELLFVIAIASIMAGFASMSAEMVRSARVSGVTQQILSDIQVARMKAMTQDAHGFGIRFKSATSYVTFRFMDCNDDGNYDTTTCAGSREETNISVRTLPVSVALKKTKPTTNFNNEVLVYDPSGLPRGWNTFGNMTIVVKNDTDENGVQCIAVSTTRVREGVWGWDKKASEYRCL